jgi:uncharacterized Tic20 family protein
MARTLGVVNKDMVERLIVGSSMQTFRATLCHAAALSGFVLPFGNILVPLVLWFLWKDRSSLVEAQGKEAVNFQAVMTLFYLLSILLIPILVGLLLLVGFGLFSLIMTVTAMVKTHRGEMFHYPLSLRLLK